MALRLPDDWAWDCWLYPEQVDGLWHIFYLKAPKSLGDPELRHGNATVGHSTSPDLTNWTHHGTVLRPGPEGAWNDRAIWTGSVIKAPDGKYNMFFTGTNKSKESGLIQRVGRATGETLFDFAQKDFVLEADGNFYERLDQNDLAGSAEALDWKEEGWRDPWVFFDERDNLWHMLVTARLIGGKTLNRGTVGHAVSSDLENWSIRAPLSGPTGFAQLEVFQIVEVAEKYVVVFCAGAADIDPASGRAQVCATYSAPCDSPTGPFHFDQAEIIDDGKHYAGRVLKDTDGVFKLLGFENGGPAGFTGIISDPLPLALTPAGVFKTI